MQASPASGLNKFLLLLILFLDLVGFTLIFPLVPDLLEHYLASAPATPIDAWLPELRAFVNESLLPADRRYTGDDIVLMGGVLASLYSILQFLAAPYWGRLSDRIGRRPVLLMTSAGLALSHVIWFFAGSFTMFIVARMLGGLMAGNMGVASAAMADTSPPEKRTAAMGLVGAAFGMGFVIGPTIGGIFAGLEWSGQGLGANQPFAAPALAAALLSLGSAGLNALLLSETLRDDLRQQSRAWIENPFRVLRQGFGPDFARIALLNLLYIIVFSAYEFTFSFFYKLEFGLTPQQIGFVFFYLGVLLVLGQGGLVRQLSKRMPSRSILLLGLALMPLPVYLLSFTPPAVFWSLLCLAPIAAGASLVQPSLAGLASLAAPDDRQGLALSVLRSFGSLGRALGPLAGAALYWFLGVHLGYLILGLLLLLTLGLALGLRQKPENDYAPSSST